MASPTTSGSICHVPRPIGGILAPVFRMKDPAIFGARQERKTMEDDGYGGPGFGCGGIPIRSTATTHILYATR